MLTWRRIELRNDDNDVFSANALFDCNVSAAEESVAHLEGYSIHKGLQSRQVVFFMETQLKKAERRNNETKNNKSVLY